MRRHRQERLSPSRPSRQSHRSSTKRSAVTSCPVPLLPSAAPGERFVYSDINFFLLGDIVRRASGERLDQYAKTRIFDVLGMADTTFLPPESWRSRIAPTERCRPMVWPCAAGDASVPFL